VTIFGIITWELCVSRGQPCVTSQTGWGSQLPQFLGPATCAHAVQETASQILHLFPF